MSPSLNIELIEAGLSDKSALRHLTELYQYIFSSMGAFQFG